MLITIIWLNLLNILIPGIVAPSLPSDCDKPSVSGFNFMKQIPLTQGRFALVDDEDFEWLNEFKWYAARIGSDNYFYAIRGDRRSWKGTQVRMHRFILGLTDPKVFVDHIDHNGLNNQRNNLRPATPSQNRRNIKSRDGSTSQYLGVHWFKEMGVWRARINKKHLGNFKNEIDAALAYNKAAIEVHGEFANLNVIETK